MSTRSVRVTVRGAFHGLTESQHAELAARQGDHDISYASYTPDGHLTYEITARPFFTFRFLRSAADEKDIPDTAAQAELDAIAWLDARGYGYKGLKATTEDLSQAPVGARQRRAAR